MFLGRLRGEVSLIRLLVSYALYKYREVFEGRGELSRMCSYGALEESEKAGNRGGEMVVTKNRKGESEKRL